MLKPRSEYTSFSRAVWAEPGGGMGMGRGIDTLAPGLAGGTFSSMVLHAAGKAGNGMPRLRDRALMHHKQ